MRKSKHRRGEIDAMYFDKLPQRAKEVFFSYLSDTVYDNSLKGGALFAEVCGFSVSEECESPIEELFDFAWSIVNFEKEASNDSPYIEFEHQKSIRVNKKNYRADFYYDSDNEINDYCEYKGENQLKLIVECDGHDFHEKTKEQVARGNQRNYDLQKEGYEIIHFSGSQIFDDPLKCAYEVYEYIQKRVGSWIKK